MVKVFRDVKFLLALLPLVLLFACSPFSRQALQQVDVTLPFNDIQKAPRKYLNKNVLWGGQIIDTNVRKNGTFITVMDKPLDFEKRPEEGDVSDGRFIIRHPGFLDPAIYKPGREISVIGAISGVEVQPVGELQYSYPVVDSKHLHLWERRAKYRRPAYWDYPVMPFPYNSYPYLYHRPPYW
ncbi:MAG: Slp family lipoprotein [Syntrophaceae bacterium]